MKDIVCTMSELKLEESASQMNLPERLEPPDNSVVISEVHSEPEDVGNTHNSTRSLRRKRANSEDSLLHSTRNKSIKKRKNSATQVELKTDKDVRKYYLNVNKNIKVKPILLETIFEQLNEKDDDDDDVRKLGRATKRTLNICDGFNINKSLTNKRKNLIKKNLGSRKKPKKIALARFIEDFKKKQIESLDSSD